MSDTYRVMQEGDPCAHLQRKIDSLNATLDEFQKEVSFKVVSKQLPEGPGTFLVCGIKVLNYPHLAYGIATYGIGRPGWITPDHLESVLWWTYLPGLPNLAEMSPLGDRENP